MERSKGCFASKQLAELAAISNKLDKEDRQVEEDITGEQSLEKGAKGPLEIKNPLFSGRIYASPSDQNLIVDLLIGTAKRHPWRGRMGAQAHGGTGTISHQMVGTPLEGTILETQGTAEISIPSIRSRWLSWPPISVFKKNKTGRKRCFYGFFLNT